MEQHGSVSRFERPELSFLHTGFQGLSRRRPYRQSTYSCSAIFSGLFGMKEKRDVTQDQVLSHVFYADQQRLSRRNLTISTRGPVHNASNVKSKAFDLGSTPTLKLWRVLHNRPLTPGFLYSARRNPREHSHQVEGSPHRVPDSESESESEQDSE